MDGAVTNNTPISTALKLGATRVIVLPTGMSCAHRGAMPFSYSSFNRASVDQKPDSS